MHEQKRKVELRKLLAVHLKLNHCNSLHNKLQHSELLNGFTTFHLRRWAHK